MNRHPLHHCNAEELLEMLRFCAHKLILAYDETLQNELWIASEKATEACASLLPLVHEYRVETITHH